MEGTSEHDEAIFAMDRLRDKGWGVQLKVLPRNFPYTVGASDSEYTPSDGIKIGTDKWMAESQWLGGSPYRAGDIALGDTPLQAMRALEAKLSKGRTLSDLFRQPTSAGKES